MWYILIYSFNLDAELAQRSDDFPGNGPQPVRFPCVGACGRAMSSFHDSVNSIRKAREQRQ